MNPRRIKALFRVLRQQTIANLQGKTSIYSIAGGAAFGLFVSVLPVIGLHTILILAIAIPLKLNKFFALLFSMVVNPMTCVPVYGFNYWVGCVLLNIQSPISDLEHWLEGLHELSFFSVVNGSWAIFMPLLVGSIVIAILSSAITFGAVSLAVSRFRRLS